MTIDASVEPMDATRDPALDHVVALEGVTKRYGEHTAVDAVDLEVRRGEFFTILGSSGSGKTTILRMIAGLVQPTTGRVLIDGADMTARKPYERDISMVFQSLALFPHMDVFSNVAFPMRMRRVGRGEIARRVRDALEIVRLPQVERRAVSELSGGQRQRVALARALVYRPRLLLLDEPLAALDRRLREDMQLELVRLHQALDVTIVNVTHDQREALMLSDRLAVMSEGRIEQIGASGELYAAPASRFVASFLGDAVLVAGDVERDAAGCWLAVGDARIALAETASERATAVLRSETIDVAARADDLDGCENRFPGTVEIAVFEGTGIYYEIRVPALDRTLKASVRRFRGAELERGDEAWVGWRAAEVSVVPA